MGLGALGIIGGLGKGYFLGSEESRRRKEADQLVQARQYALDDQADKAKMREELADANGSLEDDTALNQDLSQRKAAGINGALAQGNANTAMAQDIGNAIKQGVTQGAGITGSTATPTLDQIASGQQPQQSTGIAASADRVGDLSNTNPRQSAQPNARGMSSDQAATMAWKEKAPEIANIYRKHGRTADADAVLKSANDGEVQMYDRQLTSAMRDYYGGNYDAAAGKLSSLYNLSYPDGKFVDVQSAGNGQFQVTQYDEKTGKALGSQVIGPQEIESLMSTTLSTPERVKLMVEDRRATASGKRSDAILAASLHRDETKVATTDKTESGKTARNSETNQTRRDTNAATNTKDVTVGAGHDTARVKSAETTATAKTASKAPDKQKIQTALSNEVTKYAKNDPDVRALIASRANSYVDEDGSNITDAAARANTEYQDAVRAAQVAVEDDPALKQAANAPLGWGATDKLRDKGDKEIVASLGSRLNVKSYRDALVKKKAREALNGKSASAAPASAPQTKVIGGKTYVKQNGKWFEQ